MSYTKLLLHSIFATQNREPLLTKPIRERVYRYMSGVCRNIQCPLIIAGGVEDHAHLLSELHPTVSTAAFERDVKANSSRFIHEEFPEMNRFAWQVRYAAFTVSPSIAPKVRRYIESQEEHHKSRSFLDELRWLYEAHGLAFDAEQWDREQ